MKIQTGFGKTHRRTPQRSSDYSGFEQLDGTHPFKQAVPNGFVDYQVRRRPGGQVSFFNFKLAQEMGLIPADHPEEMNEALARKIIETFGIVIINDYDIENGVEYPEKEILPNRYMATRYLQLQHPDKRGRTSGDGRGIWNGQFRSNGSVWDVSSSGTGATCLSPAVAIEKRFFKTGDPNVGYGNGYNTMDEGLSAALMSEIFDRNGIPTERTLAIISYPGSGSSINVRAAKNLLRPSHFFNHLKQGNLENLRGAIDFFIDQQVRNGDWGTRSPESPKKRYETLAKETALRFSRLAALFESHYVFCWMDWDGDNILASGGIIDYGSIRQFGLYHRDYRYDDVDRFSTTIPEQKVKARYIVQTFAQISDYLITGEKKCIHSFRDSAATRLFDLNFEKSMNELLLTRIGISPKIAGQLAEKREVLVSDFRRAFAHFEHARSSRGERKVADGITRDAIFCMRDLLREFPRKRIDLGRHLEADEFIALMKSSYARPKDLRLSRNRSRKIRLFQELYDRLMEEAASLAGKKDSSRTLLEVCMRSSQINPADRITGDAAVRVTEALLRERKKMPIDEFHAVFEGIVKSQCARAQSQQDGLGRRSVALLRRGLRIIRRYRDGI